MPLVLVSAMVLPYRLSQKTALAAKLKHKGGSAND